jgi:hypothetical protein
MFLTDEIIFSVKKYILWLLNQVKKKNQNSIYIFCVWLKAKKFINVMKLYSLIFFNKKPVWIELSWTIYY